MRPKYWCILIWCAFSVAACSKSESHKGGPSPATSTQAKPLPYTSAKRFSDSHSVLCEKASDCHESVGALFLASSFSGRCTSWIAGELDGLSVLATNRHCVEAITNCADQVFVKFPQVGKFSAESAACKTLLDKSPFETRVTASNGEEISQVVLDYAFIQLDRKLSRSPLPLNREGIPFGQDLSTYYYDSSGPRDVIQKHIHCVSTVGANLVVSDYTSALAPNVALHGCAIKGGNSGAPVVNAGGQAVGIIQIGPKEGAVFADIPGVNSEFEINSIGVATNLACVNFQPLGLSSAGPQCQAPARSTREIVNETISKAINPQELTRALMRSLVETLKADETRFVLWESEMSTGNGRVYGFEREPVAVLGTKPKCFYRPDDPHGKLASLMTKEFFILDKWSERANFSVPFAGISLAILLDKEGVMSMVTESKQVTVNFEFNPKQVVQNAEKGAAELIEITSSGRRVKYNLGYCSPEDAAVIDSLPELDRLSALPTEEFTKALERR